MASGVVVTGLGEGAYFVAKYAKLFKEKLGFAPFHGTLNITVKKAPDFDKGIAVEPGSRFAPVHCYKARIKFRNKSINALISV